ncbi:MAG: MarR family transcriptional regulator [Lachnospiraceae bacterium]|nr:MarR family transcriptional regulator [Lachnospiraceae bacterium]
MAERYDVLKLENQLCFPLYVCAKEVVKQYKPFLDKIDLTYTQYITMMALWERKQISVKELGEILFLDSGTLTPVLKKLEQKGYINRCRSKEDERVLQVSLTEQGEALKEEAVEIPAQIGGCISLEPEEAALLYKILHKLLDSYK